VVIFDENLGRRIILIPLLFVVLAHRIGRTRRWADMGVLGQDIIQKTVHS